MKKLFILSLVISLAACTSTKDDVATVTPSDTTITIEEENFSSPPQVDNTKKKVKIARPGLISDAAAESMADVAVDLIINETIDGIGSDQDSENAEKMYEGYKKSK